MYPTQTQIMLNAYVNLSRSANKSGNRPSIEMAPTLMLARGPKRTAVRSMGRIVIELETLELS